MVYDYHSCIPKVYAHADMISLSSMRFFDEV